MDLNQVTLPAFDMPASIAFYRRMGFEVVVETAHYARFKALQGASTFSLHLAEPGAVVGGVLVYFECGALDAWVAALQAKGLVFSQEPRDERWLWREARLLDPSGNEICLYFAGEVRLNPPWRVGGQRPTGLQRQTIETPRLLLRPLQAEDLPGLLECNRDEETTRFLPSAPWKGMDDAWAWYHRVTGHMRDGRTVFYTLLTQEGQSVAGTCLLRDYDADCASIEVGYVLARPYWRRGLMQEALVALLDHAFATLPLRRVAAHIDARNLASQQLVQSLGFSREAVLREAWNDKGVVSDATIYGLLRREWEQRRKTA